MLAGRAGLHRETGQARGGRRIRARPSLLPSSAAQGRSRGHACPRTAGRRSGGIACPLWPSSEALGEMPRRSGGVRTCAPEGHAIGAAWRPWRRSHLRCGGVVIEFALNMLYEKVSTRGRVAESGSAQGLAHTRFDDTVSAGSRSATWSARLLSYLILTPPSFFVVVRGLGRAFLCLSVCLSVCR